VPSGVAALLLVPCNPSDGGPSAAFPGLSVFISAHREKNSGRFTEWFFSSRLRVPEAKFDMKLVSDF